MTWLRNFAFLFIAVLAWSAPELTPDFALLRADEDYSNWRGREITGWAKLKCLPVSGDDRWISLGGELCLRHEYYHNEGWSAELNDNDGYLLTRAYLHADVRSGPWRFFGQLQSSLSEGRRGGPGPIDEDRLDTQQAFASWTAKFAGILNLLEARLGRQEIQYGSGRLISVRAGANTRKTFDGGRIRVKTPGTTMDFFWFAPVATSPAIFDDDRVAGTHLAGIYSTIDIRSDGAKLDVYALATSEAARGYVGISGKEERWSFGVRPWGRVRSFDYNFEFVGQTGDFASESIRAWTAASDVGVSFESAAWKPRFGFKANIASGDRRPGDGRRETFNALYPKAAYFGELSPVGPANFMNLHPSITLHPGADLTVTFDAVIFWREQLEDGLYGPSLKLDRAPGNSLARHIGNQFDVLVAYRFSPFVSLEASAAVFTAGRFIEETGPARSIGYFNTSLSFTF